MHTAIGAQQELERDSQSQPVDAEETKKPSLWAACQVNKTWGTEPDLECSSYSPLKGHCVLCKLQDSSEGRECWR